VSVCRVLPAPGNPSAGQFVARRLEGMARHTKLRMVQPIPYFPGIRPLPPWAREAAHSIDAGDVEHAPMLYLPGVLKGLDGRWLSRSVSGAIRRMKAEEQIDVVDAHFAFPDGVGCVRVARRLGIPVFVTVRGVEVDQLQRRSLRRQIVTALSAATGVVSVSHTLRDVLVNAGVDGSAIRVIPNAVDRNMFRPGERGEARLRLGLPPDGRLVVSVGNLVALKRHDVLVEALARARQDVPDLMLAILGGGDAQRGYSARLEGLAAQLGLGDAVRIVGRVPASRVADWLQASNLFALATSREGCCNAVLEALACGIPVVTTPAGDNAHFVRDGVNGRLVPIDDAESLARALVETLRRDTWDPRSISATLAVGDWNSVGRQVIDFFTERMAA
jgi:glycosyltransferase involved in cell wall biosynthesis